MILFGRSDYDMMVDPNRGIVSEREFDKEGNGNNLEY